MSLVGDDRKAIQQSLARSSNIFMFTPELHSFLLLLKPPVESSPGGLEDGGKLSIDFKSGTINQAVIYLHGEDKLRNKNERGILRLVDNAWSRDDID